MVKESILFRYELTDAWGMKLSKVTVLKNRKVMYKYGDSKTKSCKLDDLSFKQIEDIIKEHSVIFEYDSFEIESPTVMDGVMNFFTFTTQERMNVDLMTFNIGEVRNPNAHFFKGLNSSNKEDSLSYDIVPVKAKNIVGTFDEIVRVLVRNGVSSKCLRLTYK